MPTRLGTETLLNTTVTDSQQQPRIAALSNGDYVATWEDRSSSANDSSGWAIRAQIMHADGTKSGSEFLVNTVITDDQRSPFILSLGSAGFVVLWNSRSTGDQDIKGQLFDTSGNKIGAEFQVNTTTTSDQFRPTASTLAGGGFVVTWTDFSATGDDTSGGSVRAQIFDISANRIGSEFVVNDTTAGDQVVSYIIQLGNGGFAIAWRDASNTGADPDGSIRGKIYNASGATTTAEFILNTTTAGSQNEVHMAQLASGGFVAVWNDFGLSGYNGGTIRGQRFTDDGSKVGTEFLVNATTVNNQFQCYVVAMADGRFIVEWMENSTTGPDTSDYAVRAQVFNADGTKSGTEFLVNTTTAGSQYASGGALLADGTFVLAWYGAGAGDPDSGSFIQRYSLSALPTITAGNTTAFTEGSDVASTPVAIAPTLTATATDADSTTLAAGKVRITGHYVASQDVLAFTGNGTTGDIAASAFDTTTGTLNLTSAGGATLAQWQAALRLVTYTNSSDAPDTTNRTIGFSLTDVDGDSAVANATVTVTAANDSPSGAVTITGSATQGQVLGITSTLSDPDGLGTFSYQWLRGNSNIASATGSSYTLTQADVGHAISVRVSYTDGGGTAESVTSTATSAVANVNDAPTGGVTVSGPLASGRIVTAVNTLADLDGMGTVAYQWLRGGTDIVGATSASYLLGAADVGQAISVRASYVDGRGTPESVTSVATAAIASAATPDTAVLTRLGGETAFTTIGQASQPVFVGLANGGYVASWIGTNPGHQVEVQVVRPDGSVVGGAFKANTTLSGTQLFGPSIAALSDGGFVVTWVDLDNIASTSALRGQRYTVDGSPQGTEFTVNGATANGGQARVVGLSNGGFAITWQQIDTTGGQSDAEIKSIQYGADGTPASATFTVNTTGTGHQAYPSISSSSAGNYVIVWVDYSNAGGDHGSSDIRAQIFQNDGSPLGNEIFVNTTIAGDQLSSSVAYLKDGSFVVTWADSSSATSGSDIRAQHFSSTGAKQGPEFVVPTTNAGAQINPFIAGLSDGRYVITWTDWNATLSVRAQIFNADDTPSGVESLANSTISGSRFNTGDAALADGSFLVGWFSGTTPYVQRLAYSTPPVVTTSGPASFTEGSNTASSPIAIAPTLTATDSDSTTLRAGKVQISGHYVAAQDLLAFTGNAGTGDITASAFDTTTGTLALSSSSGATLAQWQAALRLVTYTNNSDAPDTTARTVGFTLSDVASDSTLATVTVSVTAANDSPTGSLTATGTPAAGQTLTATSTLADPDGLGAFSYQWTRDGGDIAGATAATFALTASDVAHQIAVRVSYTDGGGTLETVSSAAVTVSATPAPAPAPPPAAPAAPAPTPGIQVIAPATGGTVSGSVGDDTLVGQAGNDVFYPFAGRDTIDGGAGLDTVVFIGSPSQYTVTRATDGTITVQQVDLAGKPTANVATLQNVERVVFGDGTGLAFDTTGTAGQAYRLYQSSLGRTPDAAGLAYQFGLLDKGVPLFEVARAFLLSAEFQRVYGTLGDTAYITQLYANVLGRAPDPAGLAFHAGVLTQVQGIDGRIDTLLTFSESAELQAKLIGVTQGGMAFA